MNSKLPYEYIQFLNEHVIENLHIPYIRVGDKLNLRCPFCGDSHKSATKRRGWWYCSSASYFCFNCGLSLSGIKFLEAISGANYIDIKKQYFKMLFKHNFSSDLSSQIEQPHNEPTLFEMRSIIKPEWKNPLSTKALTYLTERKVLEAPFKHGDFYSSYGKNNDEYILIPWTINGEDAYYQLNDFQHLHGMKYIFPKAKKKLLYGLDNVDLSFPYIFLFEGAYDSIFVKNGVATGTKAITDYQLSLIKNRYPHHQLVVSFDNDEAGLKSMMSLIRKDSNFKYFKWFNQNTREKDINDYVLSKGNVNIFADVNVLKRLIIDKLLMKMFLIQCGIWSTAQNRNRVYNDTSSQWKTRKIQFC